MAGVGSYLNQLRELVKCYTKDGKLLDTPTGRIGEKGLSADINEFLRSFTDLLLNSRMLSQVSKDYIKDPYITQRGIGEKEGLNLSTVQSRIWADKNKIFRYFRDNMLLDLIEYMDTSSLDRYKQGLNDAWSKYSNTRRLKNIALKLPNTDNVSGRAIHQSEFDEFIYLVTPYTTSYMQGLSTYLSADVVAYCNRILATTELDDAELENKSQLIDSGLA